MPARPPGPAGQTPHGSAPGAAAAAADRCQHPAHRLLAAAPLPQPLKIGPLQVPGHGLELAHGHGPAQAVDPAGPVALLQLPRVQGVAGQRHPAPRPHPPPGAPAQQLLLHTVVLKFCHRDPPSLSMSRGSLSVRTFVRISSIQQRQTWRQFPKIPSPFHGTGGPVYFRRKSAILSGNPRRKSDIRSIAKFGKILENIKKRYCQIGTKDI